MPAWQCTVKQMNSRVDKHKICAPPTHFTWRLCCKVVAGGQRYPHMSLCVLNAVLTSKHSIIQWRILCEFTFLDSCSSKSLYFPSVCCLIQFFSEDSQLFQTELRPPSHKSLYAFDFIKLCGSCCPFFLSVTVHSACLWLPILRGLLLTILPGLLLSILCISYCPFCVPLIAHSAGSVTTHSVGLLLLTLRVLLPMLRILLSILRVCYGPYCGYVTAHSVRIPSTYPCNAGTSNSSHMYKRFTIRPKYSQYIRLCSSAGRVPQNGTHRQSRCYELFVDFCIRCIYWLRFNAKEVGSRGGQ